MSCFFVSDLHGRTERYARLFAALRKERPGALFVGGDFLPSGLEVDTGFVESFLGRELGMLRVELGAAYPRVLLIFGNDDHRSNVPSIRKLESEGLVEWIHDRSVMLGDARVFGYSYVPPTPFTLKDWERYDVGRHVEPGCISPEDGYRSVPVDPIKAKYATIASDLTTLAKDCDVTGSIWLFHSPPYKTKLDRAALDGQSIDHAPLDVHVGSIAIRRFIEERQPLVTLHGHIHESARLSGSWRDRLGETEVMSAAHDGPELALVRFELDDPSSASRELLG